jgi:putative ABC transport system permease protein
MTLARFVTKNAFRNKRRSMLTMLSIAFSLFLLTFMMTLWHAFAVDDGSTESVKRLVVRHRSSLMFNLPSYYGGKMRTIPGVVAVVPLTWFQGLYKDQKPENFFARFGTDPTEFPKVYRDMQISDDQLEAWQRDRQGVIVDDTLAKKHGWKLGDRIFIHGDLYPINLELNVRGIFHTDPDNKSVYFNSKYLERAFLRLKGRMGDRNSWYCVDEAGHIQLEQRVHTTAKALREVFGEVPRRRIALETGTHSPWISRLLSELGHEVIVAHAHKVPGNASYGRHERRAVPS